VGAVDLVATIAIPDGKDIFLILIELQRGGGLSEWGEKG